MTVALLVHRDALTLILPLFRLIAESVEMPRD